MSTMLIGTGNVVSSGILTATSEAAGLGVGQLQNDQGAPSTAWQTAAGVTSASLLIDSSVMTTLWRLFGLFRTNLTASATVRWRIANAVSGGHVTGTLAYDSGTISAGVVPGYGQSVVIAPADVMGRYGQVDIVDASNPRGLLNVALVFAGSAWQPNINFDWGSSQSRNHQTAIQVSWGGQQHAQPQWIQRLFNIELSNVSDAEVWSDLDNIDRLSRLGGNLLFVPDITSPKIQQQAVFGILTPSTPINYPSQMFDRRGWSAQITERL